MSSDNELNFNSNSNDGALSLTSELNRLQVDEVQPDDGIENSK